MTVLETIKLAHGTGYNITVYQKSKLITLFEACTEKQRKAQLICYVDTC